MGDEQTEVVDPRFAERKLTAEIAIEHRKLDIEERKFSQQAKTHPLTLMISVVPAASTLISALCVVYVTTKSNMDLKTAEGTQALIVQSKNAELKLEQQIRQQRFDIIVQATKDVKRDIASENLLFFVEAGILTDADGKISNLAKRGAAPELGTPPRVNDLTTSGTGIDFLKGFIPLSLSKTRYSNGTEFIGYNHWALEPNVVLENGTVIDLTQGQITAAQAEALLKHDLAEVEESINASVKVRLSQTQFDALMSFVSNVGPRAFESSDILRAINMEAFDEVPDLMRSWKNISDVEVPELKERRELEIARWMHASR